MRDKHVLRGASLKPHSCLSADELNAVRAREELYNKQAAAFNKSGLNGRNLVDTLKYL